MCNVQWEPQSEVKETSRGDSHDLNSRVAEKILFGRDLGSLPGRDKLQRMEVRKMRAGKVGAGEIISDNKVKDFDDMSTLEDRVTSRNLLFTGFMFPCMGTSISITPLASLPTYLLLGSSASSFFYSVQSILSDLFLTML